MKIIKHIDVPVESYGWINTDNCPCHDTYAHYLWMAAPEISWYYVEDVGDYQGTVYAIGKYKGEWFVMKDYYGSCSVCGAWGEGGEPEKLEDVLGHGELFKKKQDAHNFVVKTWGSEYESPTKDFLALLTKKEQQDE